MNLQNVWVVNDLQGRDICSNIQFRGCIIILSKGTIRIFIKFQIGVMNVLNFSFDLYQGLPMQRRGQGVLHGRDQQVQTRDRKGKELGQVRKKFNCLYFLWKTLRNDMSISTIGLQSRNEENFTVVFIQKWNIQAHLACVFF